MRVIILAAGQSKRFQQAGYKTPKPYIMVDWNGRTATMLEHVINTLPLEFQDVDIAVPPTWPRPTYEPGINFREIGNTKGPADTAYQMIKGYDMPDSYLIMDTDILNTSNDLLKLSKLNNCGVLVRRSANPSYSYVDKLGEFHHIKEKERISDYAVQGAYFLARPALYEFLRLAEHVISVEPEPYMSHMFDRLTLLKYAVPTTYIPVDWGTPKDVEMSGAFIMSDMEEKQHARD